MLDLPAGSYYLAVVDYAGVAERYSMCIRVIPQLAVIRTCSLILPGPAVPQRSKVRRPAASPSRAAAGGTEKPFLVRRRP